jgi:UDP-N-acetylmuramoyl-tripeptide--D-alanyl-D-alanine ligase
MAEVPHVSRRLCDTGAVTDTRPREPRPGEGQPALTAVEISEATGGRLVRSSDMAIRGAAVDSRAVAPGNLFVALPGEITDGHRFLEHAISAGAAALLVREADWSAGAGTKPAGAVDAEAVAGVLAAADRAGAAIVAVPDTLAALHAVATVWRGRFSPLVVGVTGSIAKTSTKEAVTAVLGERYTTLKSEGNANNEIGLPLTVLRMGPEHEAAVLEMGMYVGGEIAQLAAIARPRIGVVTAVREVHLSRIGSIEAVERAKAELVEALPADGTAVLNADDARVAGMRNRTAARTITYGFSPEADVRGGEVVSGGLDGMRFDLVTPAGTVRVSTPALGRHGVYNGLAAAAVGLAAGLDLGRIAAGLAIGWQAQHRDQIVRIPGLTILDDTYNASPASMLAAMELLSTLPGRHVAVLGEMFELGDAQERGNREVGVAAVALVDLLVVVGDGAAGIAAGAAKLGDRVVRVPSRETAMAVLRERLRPGDAVLVKASRSAALELLVASLAGEFGGWIAGTEARGGAHPFGEEVR